MASVCTPVRTTLSLALVALFSGCCPISPSVPASTKALSIEILESPDIGEAISTTVRPGTPEFDELSAYLYSPSNLKGTVSFVTFNQHLVVTADTVMYDFLDDVVAVSVRNDTSKAWAQSQRRPTAEDVKFKARVREILKASGAVKK